MCLVVLVELKDAHEVQEGRIWGTELGGKGSRLHNLGKTVQIWSAGQREIIMAGRERCETVKVCWIRSSSGVRSSRKLYAAAHDAYSLAFTHVS